MCVHARYVCMLGVCVCACFYLYKYTQAYMHLSCVYLLGIYACVSCVTYMCLYVYALGGHICAYVYMLCVCVCVLHHSA